MSLSTISLPPVILSAVGAHATAESKDPEDAYRNQAVTGSFLETETPSSSQIPPSCSRAGENACSLNGRQDDDRKKRERL
jgi:hypothetical protein